MSDDPGTESPLAALGRPPSRSLLMRHEESKDDIITFLDALPPFGVLQIASVTWEALGRPDEVLVSVTPTSGAQAVSDG